MTSRHPTSPDPTAAGPSSVAGLALPGTPAELAAHDAQTRHDMALDLARSIRLSCAAGGEDGAVNDLRVAAWLEERAGRFLTAPSRRPVRRTGPRSVDAETAPAAPAGLAGLVGRRATGMLHDYLNGATPAAGAEPEAGR